jgi:hypothetical protein
VDCTADQLEVKSVSFCRIDWDLKQAVSLMTSQKFLSISSAATPAEVQDASAYSARSLP